MEEEDRQDRINSRPLYVELLYVFWLPVFLSPFCLSPLDEQLFPFLAV
jgi:hypothetical protein